MQEQLGLEFGQAQVGKSEAKAIKTCAKVDFARDRKGNVTMRKVKCMFEVETSSRYCALHRERMF